MMPQILWYQMILFFLAGAIAGSFIVMLAVLLGGWLVFRTKTINTPSAFMQPVRRSKKNRDGRPRSYLPDGLSMKDDDIGSILDEELSSPAARLREQKSDMGEMAETMRIVKGAKK